jgi:aldose 1-epimerase
MESPPSITSICNTNGIRAILSSRGASLLELHLPDASGEQMNVVDSRPSHRFAGVTIGRVANRIRDGAFDLDGEHFELTRNEGKHHLHGGSQEPLDELLWDAEKTPSSVRFHIQSPHGTGGYPGTLDVQASFLLTEDNALVMEYSATTDRPTPVNLTNHAYWNLGGPIQEHELMIGAQRYAPTDKELIPTGSLDRVAGTALDFTRPRPLGAAPIDHTFGLDNCSPAAVLKSLQSSRCMEVQTTQAALQLFTTEHALCLEAQGFPDAVHQTSFPSVILRPGEVYFQTTIHRFWNE